MTSRQQAVVLFILLCGFFIRTYNSTAQEAFLDEGFHAYRANYIWELQENPGQNSDGKFLLYYYLGLFGANPTNALAITRMAVGMFSVITAATVYLLGRKLLDHRAGVLAMAIYTLLPLVTFYERMALADPFAATFGILLVWRSYVFAKRPSWREAAILGVLMALTTMAKLTMIMLPGLPVITSLLFMPVVEKGWLTRWRASYLRYILFSWVIMLILWLPVLIPSYFAAKAGHPYLLIDTNVVINYGDSALTYVSNLITNSHALIHVSLLILALVSLIGLFLFERTMASGTLLLFWIALCLLPLVSYASQPTPRYIINVMAPLCLAIGLFISYLWNQRRQIFRLVGGLAFATTAGWAIFYALPFNAVLVTNPLNLPLDEPNYWFVNGAVNTNDAHRQAGQYLETLPGIENYYADWTVCRLMFFTTDVHVTCLERSDVIRQMNNIMQARSDPRGIYLITGPWELDLRAVKGMCVTQIAFFDGVNHGVTAWLLQPGVCQHNGYTGRDLHTM
jgi:4-amino-4-deoxy-L-arabinose transferase-like glycosyltransferase